MVRGNVGLRLTAYRLRPKQTYALREGIGGDDIDGQIEREANSRRPARKPSVVVCRITAAA